MPDPFSATAPGEGRVARALLSVWDKRGIVAFARGLAELGVELVSTGGTARALTEAGLSVRAIEDFTGFPELMDGRVKTLHPKLYAGLLARRDDPGHLEAARRHDVEWVDLVCVNLYPFEETVARSGATRVEIIENIDIGGPTMIRAAAKNHAYAAVVVRPEAYDPVLEELNDSGGTIAMATREALAADAFALTARYDTAISRWFADPEDFPSLLVGSYEKVSDLSYGENPHQRAAYYRRAGAPRHLLGEVRQHHGKQLSYNNLLDVEAARVMVRGFDEPACVIVKHNNPCGVALGSTPQEAYEGAFACDPLSAFGGVIALNSEVDEALAGALHQQFIEVLLAPGYTRAARAVLGQKQSIRILQDDGPVGPSPAEPVIRQVTGALLVQDADVVRAARDTMVVATRRTPTEAEWADLLFAWEVVKHVKSNAIVLVKGRATVGIGAGQMSRVDAVRLAIDKAELASLASAVLASDAFFPFADGPERAIEAGITAVVQPGGSVRDDEVIAVADEAGIAMVLTGQRHFRH